MKYRIGMIVLALLPAWASGDTILQEFNEAYTVHGPATNTVLEVAAPAVKGKFYAIKGTVSYEGVTTPGFLEMWSHFADGARYFSRTLAEQGPMQQLKGRSEDRPFVLPFNPMGKHPSRLVVNVVLPGEGTVSLHDLVLVESANFREVVSAEPGAWWSHGDAGIVFGTLGAVIGCLFGLIGLLSAKGRARMLVTVLLGLFIVLGLVSLVAGLVALQAGQPYQVRYPLFLIGALLFGVGLFTFRQVTARYAKAELDRMRVMDA